MYNVKRQNIHDTKSVCYIGRRIGEEINDYGTEIPIYEKPIKYMFNIMPLSSDLDIAEYGEKISSMYKTILTKNLYIGKIKEGDIAYLNGANPEGENINTYGSNGNYIVRTVMPQNTVIVVYFERLQK